MSKAREVIQLCEGKGIEDMLTDMEADFEEILDQDDGERSMKDSCKQIKKHWEKIIKTRVKDKKDREEMKSSLLAVYDDTLANI